MFYTSTTERLNSFDSMKQSTNHILMIRPVMFRFNEQTAVNNYYMHKPKHADPEDIQREAKVQFDTFVETLRNHGVHVIAIEDTIEPSTPDSIFPNNWVSFHSDGRIGVYPMYASNRRHERREEIFKQLRDNYDFQYSEIVDFTHHEAENKFLEATGSMILDRPNKIVYAAISERMYPEILEEFCEKFAYKPVVFHANQSVGDERLPIYHTNVMMCVADDFAVICLDSIDDVNERNEVVETLEQSGKEIIEITEDQSQQFAGNMLQVYGKNNQLFLVMSSAAYHSLSPGQLNRIESYCSIIHSDLSTIESLGGGSARCMMAEVFLPKK